MREKSRCAGHLEYKELLAWELGKRKGKESQVGEGQERLKQRQEYEGCEM